MLRNYILYNARVAHKGEAFTDKNDESSLYFWDSIKLTWEKSYGS